MTSLIEDIAEHYDHEMLRMDGYDDCVVGVVERFNQDPILCYDREKVIQKLMGNDKMTHEEAEEFYEFNQKGAWMGEGTPCFLITKETL